MDYGYLRKSSLAKVGKALDGIIYFEAAKNTSVNMSG